MRRYCFALDLKDDPQLINEYEQHHREVWPEVLESLKSNGIERMEIYRVVNRLFMIMEVDENIFDFERCKLEQATNAKVQEWEKLMWKYQKALPTASPGEKWMLMEKIFEM